MQTDFFTLKVARSHKLSPFKKCLVASDLDRLRILSLEKDWSTPDDR